MGRNNVPASARNIRDQNLGALDSAREMARQVAAAGSQAAETTQEAIRSAVDTASRTLQGSAEQFSRSFGFSGQQGEQLARESTRNLEAISECGAVLLRGFQELSREWLNLCQQRFQKNFEAVQVLASCQTMQDVMTAQTELVRRNVQEMIENTRQIAETSANVAQEAAATLTSKRKSGSPRLHRAA
jgi:phasin family protein